VFQIFFFFRTLIFDKWEEEYEENEFDGSRGTKCYQKIFISESVSVVQNPKKNIFYLPVILPASVIE
jgi:hypothetical protein